MSNLQGNRKEIYTRKKRSNIQQIRDFGIPGMNALFINENVTKQQKTLFMEAKTLKKKFNYQYLWTNKGETYTKKNKESQVLKISDQNDLSRIP